MIYNPLEEYENKFKDLHLAKATEFFENLVKLSGVNPEENRKTVRQHNEYKDNLKKFKKKLNLWRFLRVLMIITLVLIPLVILKITPKIKALREDINLSEQKAAELLASAHRQMAPLNRLFTDRDALKIIESTIPMLTFAPYFSTEQEANMVMNYDFFNRVIPQQTTVDLLSGNYNENPFLFEKRLTHRMGVETYHGYKTIQWTETYRGSDGEIHTRTETQRLHASVTKPKPFYSTQVLLNYCAQGGPELSFSRDASHLERKSEKELERHVKKGEKKLKKMTDKAIKENRDFVSMSNSDFEVMFDALNRTNEVQYRTLFTPLAQTNMVDLLISRTGYGDDFDFIKKNRTNIIISKHSQGRALNLLASSYTSYSFDTIKELFISKNTSFFKAVYFDFAPLWAIPIYQERPVHSLKPIPDYAQTYSHKECESIANKVPNEYIAHPRTQTPVILKTSFVGSQQSIDEICVTASSYDIIKRIALIPVYGDDGKWHDVPVPWDEYIPLEEENNFFICAAELAYDKAVLARKNNLCIFKNS
ncbi:MAG: hypothetical protein J6A83_01865 [Clostridia bacterium]|nr:hypothetical protein [Clostridia bacterium]